MTDIEDNRDPEDVSIEALMVAVLNLMGPMKEGRWQALTFLLITACGDDIERAIRLTEAACVKYNLAPFGPPPWVPRTEEERAVVGVVRRAVGRYKNDPGDHTDEIISDVETILDDDGWRVAARLGLRTIAQELLSKSGHEVSDR